MTTSRFKDPKDYVYKTLLLMLTIKKYLKWTFMDRFPQETPLTSSAK